MNIADLSSISPLARATSDFAQHQELFEHGDDTDYDSRCQGNMRPYNLEATFANRQAFAGRLRIRNVEAANTLRRKRASFSVFSRSP